jgi:hypothetical protein
MNLEKLAKRGGIHCYISPKVERSNEREVSERRQVGGRKERQRICTAYLGQTER